MMIDVSNSKKGASLDSKIFWPSVIIIIALCIPFALYESSSVDLLNGIFDVIVNNFGWGYIWYSIILVGAGFYIAFSKYGKVVLGSPDDKPQFSMFEYASILIAMGLGSTIMRTGMMQWASVAINPPFGVEPLSNEAIMWGNPYGMFLWSLQTFAIFVMSAPAMGYILHVRKRPLLRISEACRCVLGDKFTEGIGGKILDILFLVSIVAGAGCTLGLGTPIVTTLLSKMFGLKITFGLTLIITIVWIIAFTASAYLGIEKGIKRLSTFNMYLAAAFGIFVLLVGPGVFILNHFTDNIGFLLKNYIDISFYSNSLGAGAGYIQKYTVFWFAYCATWALLHSVFAATISKGRTIKEMILTYFFAPLFLSWVATGILGGLSINRYLTGAVPVLDIVQNGGGSLVAIGEVLASLPMPYVAMSVFLFVTMVFLITTLDSTTYTIAAYVSTDDMSKNEPSQNVRLITCFMISVFALVLMRIGGLAPLEVVSGLMGIPIIFVQFITIYAAKKMIDEDKAWIHNIRK
ncbi:MAG: choline transporter [Geosporobacter ferrireducens]|nr:choline transporter [Geosporobacter ferrireducens]